ncbi:glycoside hydrolase family 18 protein [Vibrio cholerae]|uniref:glycoside hydrolase family 18 protein n=1 Tax=Vibrio cholerae TaxID=666 RepID=UPI003967B982
MKKNHRKTCKYGALALLSATSLSAHSSEPVSTAYLTSWGLTEDAAAALEKSNANHILLSFGEWDENLEVMTSDGIASIPEYDPYWMPNSYILWTQDKLKSPERNYLIAFGGQTYENIWDYIATDEQRDLLVDKLSALLDTEYPVYKKNASPDEVVKCLSYNWNGTQCEYNNYQMVGTTKLDGLDFDFEKGARITEQENENLLKLVSSLRQRKPDAILSLTTYHVGADPVECANNDVFEGCSYTENQRSSHHGEVLPALTQGKDLFDMFNVMAYDAGKNFDYQQAMKNYAQVVGDAGKVVLGVTMNSQWAPKEQGGNFVETKEKNLERGSWQSNNGYGGTFVWAFGFNTEQMSFSDQVDYYNEIIESYGDSSNPPAKPSFNVFSQVSQNLLNSNGLGQPAVNSLYQIDFVLRDQTVHTVSFEIPNEYWAKFWRWPVLFARAVNNENLGYAFVTSNDNNNNNGEVVASSYKNKLVVDSNAVSNVVIRSDDIFNLEIDATYKGKALSAGDNLQLRVNFSDGSSLNFSDIVTGDSPIIIESIRLSN